MTYCRGRVPLRVKTSENQRGVLAPVEEGPKPSSSPVEEPHHAGPTALRQQVLAPRAWGLVLDHRPVAEPAGAAFAQARGAPVALPPHSRALPRRW